MRKAPLCLLAVSLLWLLLPAASPEAKKKKKPPLRPVFTPLEGGENCTVQGSAVAYQSEELVALLIPLRPHEEEAFFEKHAGKALRIFSTAEEKSPFSVFRLTLKNLSKEDLRFNAHFTSLKSKRGHYAQSKSYAELYESYRGLSEWEAIQKIFQTKLWDGAMSVRPGESFTRLLVFPQTLTARDKKALMDLSWVYVGRESFHLEFPYAVAWEELKNGAWVKKGE